MKKLTVILLCAAMLCAGAASAAIVITLNGYRNVSVTLEPVGLCGSTGDCVFNITVAGSVLDSADVERSRETFSFRSDIAQYNLNQTAMTNLYRKSRRVWKSQVLNEDVD